MLIGWVLEKSEDDATLQQAAPPPEGGPFAMVPGGLRGE